MVLEKFGKVRYEIMREMIDSLSPEDSVIIDIGASGNPITTGIRARRIITVDILPQNRPGIVADLTKNFPFKDESVDIVVAGEILEHIYHSTKFLKEIRRVLGDGGHLIISVPNIVSLKYRAAFLFGKIPSHAARGDTFYSDNRPGHIRDYSFCELEQLLWNERFRVIKRAGDGLSFKGKTLIPRWMLPATFQDSVIMLAKKV